MAKKKRFSMRPEQAEEGLFGNCWARITGARYTTYGALDNERLIVGNRTTDDPVGVIEFEQDGTDNPVEQYFSCGPATKLVPSEDGEEAAEEGPFLCPAEGSSAVGLSKNSNMYHLLASLAKPAEGKLKFNSALLDDKGIDALIGIYGFWARVPAPRISSVAVEEGARERTMVVCQEIGELGKGAKTKGKPAPDEDEEEEPAPKKGKIDKKFPKAVEEEEPEEEADDVTAEAQKIVDKALQKAGDAGIKRDQLIKKVFNQVAKSDNRKEILALLKDDDFISDGPWNWDEAEETLTAIES